jgi:hypothetical protein
LLGVWRCAELSVSARPHTQTWPPEAHYDFLMSCIYDKNPLDALHRADLEKSGLSAETISRQRFRSVPPSMIDKLLGFPAPKVMSGYVLPFFRPTGELLDHIRLKVFPPIATKKGTIRYLQPKHSGIRLYVRWRRPPEWSIP